MFDILHRVGIKASRDRVYKALATPEGVAGWWTAETTGDNKAGGTIRFRFTDNGRELGVFDMKILELLVKEKAHTRARDALAAERRRMPWVAVEKAYTFDGPRGKASLLDLVQLAGSRALNPRGLCPSLA